MGNEKELKIGDRVKVISVPKLNEAVGTNVRIGMVGTVLKRVPRIYAGVRFDEHINGDCWYVPYECLKKIEETKTETFEQKILKVLREEIGVTIGEEFDVYENGEKKWTCKFWGNEFFCKVGDKFWGGKRLERHCQ